jgi:membrane protease YdiL (CAAX protease family)
MTPAAVARGIKRNDIKSMSKRVTALLEVVLAFVLVHVTYRALKYFTPLGTWEGETRLNFTPGTVMILVTVLAVLLCGRSFESCGLTWNRWWHNLNIGLLWTLLLVVVAGMGRMFRHIHFDAAFPQPDMASRIAGVVFGLVAMILLLWLMTGEAKYMDRVPWATSVVLLAALLSLPLALAGYFHRPVGREILEVTWLFVCAGFGEEIFFRGYIQSRINETFERPYHVLGLDFGPGLLVSSLLFGFLHALSPVDYFHGHWEFAWWYGLQNCFVGLFYGCLREKTESVVAGGVTHGLVNVLARVAVMISRF